MFSVGVGNSQSSFVSATQKDAAAATTVFAKYIDFFTITTIWS